jgi:hypothetical protein
MPRRWTKIEEKGKRNELVDLYSRRNKTISDKLFKREKLVFNEQS